MCAGRVSTQSRAIGAADGTGDVASNPVADERSIAIDNDGAVDSNNAAVLIEVAAERVRKFSSLSDAYVDRPADCFVDSNSIIGEETQRHIQR